MTRDRDHHSLPMIDSRARASERASERRLTWALTDSSDLETIIHRFPIMRYRDLRDSLEQPRISSG